MFIVSLLTVILLLFQADLAWAEVKTDIKYTYYPVQLTTEDTSAQVLRLMVKAMPSNVGDTRRLASASPTFELEYRVKRKFNKCKIIDVQLNSSCTILLPAFKGGDLALKHRLGPISKYVEDHELTHCGINAKYANILEKNLFKLGEVECTKLEGVAKAELKRVWDEGWRAQEAFDKQEQVRGAGGTEWLHFNYFSETHSKPVGAPSTGSGNLNLNDNLESSGIRRNKDGSWSNW